MAHWKKSFPSKYLQAADLDTPIPATLKTVVNENIGIGDAADLKPVAQWEEAHVKGVVLNLTRAEALADIAGDDDMDHWPGTRVLLQRGSTRYQGKKVACIEIVKPPVIARAPRPKTATSVAPPPLSTPVPPGNVFEEPIEDESPA
jgi:hypothetical protein